MESHYLSQTAVPSVANTVVPKIPQNSTRKISYVQEKITIRTLLPRQSGNNLATQQHECGKHLLVTGLMLTFS
jgi:hypothetical protein